MIVINLRRRLLLLAIFSLSQFVLAQNVDFNSTNFKSDKEGLKSAEKNIKIADEFREKALLNVLSMQDARGRIGKCIFTLSKST